MFILLLLSVTAVPVHISIKPTKLPFLKSVRYKCADAGDRPVTANRDFLSIIYFVMHIRPPNSLLFTSDGLFIFTCNVIAELIYIPSTVSKCYFSCQSTS
jgi:hypothetical protein